MRPLYSLLLLAGCSTPIRPSQDSTAPLPPPSAVGSTSAEPPSPPSPVPSASAPTIPGAQRFSAREVPDDPQKLMAPFSLDSREPLRRTLFSWTTRAQAETMKTGKKLLFRGASDVAVDAPFETRIRHPKGTPTQQRVQLMMSKPPLDKHRFAFANPIGWSVGVSGAPYGSVLVRVTLREEAILLGLGEMGAIRAFNASGLVADDAMAQHPERVAVVFHEGMDSRGTLFREYVLVNEGMIESWALGTEDIRQELARAQEAIERLILVSPEASQVEGPELRLLWYGQRAGFPEAPWSNVLGVGSPTYHWTRNNLRAILAHLKAAEHPVTLEHHPGIAGPVRLPPAPPEPPKRPMRPIFLE